MSALLRYVGALSADLRRALVQRSLSAADPQLVATVGSLIAEVRRDGDDALRAQMRRFAGVELSALEVPREAWRAAFERQSPSLIEGLERAARNIRAVHAAQAPKEIVVEPEPGVRVGRRPDPISRVGVYAPGGRAAYPSSVLMGAVPARVAGVGEVIVCSPAGSSGVPSDVVLCAALIAGADRVFAVGGAAAVAAMAFGTQSLPRVDRIVGPGNAYVAEAKRQVQSVVGIDSPAGPSEILVIADDGASSQTIAAELLAQAEHDPDACVVALVTNEALAAAVVDAVSSQFAALGSPEVARRALASRGAVLTLRNLEEAFAFSNDFAPEHLLLLTRTPGEDLRRVRNAGTVFLGQTTSVAFGDYVTGANHVLPTAGTARVFSGLSSQDFYRWTTWQQVDERAAARLAEVTAQLAQSEGLAAHAAAARRAGGAR